MSLSVPHTKRDDVFVFATEIALDLIDILRADNDPTSDVQLSESERIEALDRLSEQITALDDECESASHEEETAREEVESLEQQVESLEQQVSDLEGHVEELEDLEKVLPFLQHQADRQRWGLDYITDLDALIIEATR